MNLDATRFSEQIIAATGDIADQVERGSAASREAVERAAGSRIAEIQSRTRQVVASLTGVAAAIEQMCTVTGSISIAMEQQRAAIQSFSASTRMTNSAVSDVAGRMANIADLIDRSGVGAAEIAEVSTEMKRISQSLRRGIPQIVQKATRADMRESTRYDVDMSAQVEVNGRSFTARVHDISESGMRVEKRPEPVVGASIMVTFKGLQPVSGRIVRVRDSSAGVCFEPQRLQIEEVRRLVTAVAA